MNITAHDWLNLNSLRSFPLIENHGIELIPNNFIVDLSILVTPLATYPCRIATIGWTGRLLSIIIKDKNDLTLGYSTIDTEETRIGEIISLTSQINGSLVLGDEKITLPIGNHNIDAELIGTTCIPIESGLVTSLGILGQEESLQGDIKIEAGDNVKLDYNLADNSIVASLENEAAFIPECEFGCDPDRCFRTPIQFINGIPGTEGSCDFFIEGKGIITVGENHNAITIGSDDIKPADLCDNYTKAPEGDPGNPGPPGGGGPPGKLICLICLENGDLIPIFGGDDFFV